MSDRKMLHLVGYASGIAGAESDAGNAPYVIQKSPFIKYPESLKWDNILEPLLNDDSVEDVVLTMCTNLAKETDKLTRDKKAFCVVGGDHSSAMGTWSGVANAIREEGDLGLIWIDAHMDSHTPTTSESGHIHGMPLAVLLGEGNSRFTHILNVDAKLKPQNVCLIGVRSFEQGEADTLNKLNVRVYYIEEVQERGYMTVWREAVAHVKKSTVGFGITFDVDSIDPDEAPGVDVPAENGIQLSDFYEGLKEVVRDPKLLGAEIVEFDPTHDRDHKTEKIMTTCLDIISQS